MRQTQDVWEVSHGRLKNVLNSYLSAVYSFQLTNDDLKLYADVFNTIADAPGFNILRSS